MTNKTPCTAGRCDAARVVRAIGHELDRSITLIEHYRRPDDRARGQLEALRHIQTTLDIQTGRTRKRRR